MSKKGGVTAAIAVCLAITLAGGLLRPTKAQDPGTTERVSVACDGTEANAASSGAAISADGRYVAFRSQATNLLSGDTNDYCGDSGTDNCSDVFVYDRQADDIERVSVASDGTEGNGHSWPPAISADGRYVAFVSRATNLVPNDTNGWHDVFVHDRQTGHTQRISVASDGTQADDLSGCQLSCDYEGENCYWVCGAPAISADGRLVAFGSWATNLVLDDTNDTYDVFVHDRQTGETSRVSLASDGTEAEGLSDYPAISADGRYVAFQSRARNLVSGDDDYNQDVFLHDRQTGQTTRVTEANGDSTYPSLSADARFVAFFSFASDLVSDDSNDACDVFVRDLQTLETTRSSVASDGTEANGWSLACVISRGGRYVAFISGASNLVPGDANDATDVFLHDNETGITQRMSVASDGTEGNGWSSYFPAISATGRHIAFISTATNLVPNDTNGCTDIFVRDREGAQTTELYLPLVMRQ